MTLTIKTIKNFGIGCLVGILICAGAPRLISKKVKETQEVVDPQKIVKYEEAKTDLYLDDNDNMKGSTIYVNLHRAGSNAPEGYLGEDVDGDGDLDYHATSVDYTNAKKNPFHSVGGAGEIAWHLQKEYTRRVDILCPEKNLQKAEEKGLENTVHFFETF